MKMILRPKKPINLQQPILQDNLYTINHQASTKKYDKLQQSSYYNQQNKTKYAQILTKFINNINKSKKQKHIPKDQQNKNITKNIQNINKIQYNISINKNGTKNRKSSQITQNYEQKKLQCYHYQNINKTYNQTNNKLYQQNVTKTYKQQQKYKSITQKKKAQVKHQKAQELSTKFSPQLPQNYLNNFTGYPSQQQNILNNYLSLNNIEYTNFISNQFINNFNPQFLNPWFTMNQFYKPNVQNIQNIQYFPDQMLSGLYRQFKIYEDFNKNIQNNNINANGIYNTNINNNNANLNNFNHNSNNLNHGNFNINENINTKSQSYRKVQQFKSATIINKQQKQKVIYKHQQIKQTKQKIQTHKKVQSAPIKKVFKRSTYHIAIAYSIYWDQLKKQGKLSRNIQEMDPTLPARKLKHPQLSKNQ